MNLNAWLRVARKENFAIGHFNVSDFGGLKAVIGAAEALGAPVIIGVSDGERYFLGTGQIVALVRAFREETGLPIFLNADHAKSLESFKEAVDAGFDSVHFDGSELPYDQNVLQTKQAVLYAKSKNPDISVEGELGYLRGSSRVQEVVEIKPEDMTDPDMALEFVKATGVDRLAPVFGNIHGIVQKVIVAAPTSGVGVPTEASGDEKLDIERLRAIAVKTDAFLVLHGGSGLSASDIQAAIKAGTVKAHINTELRVAYRQGLEQALRQMPGETTPYKYLPVAIQAMQKVVEEKIRLFGSAGKARSTGLVINE